MRSLTPLFFLCFLTFNAFAQNYQGHPNSAQGKFRYKDGSMYVGELRNGLPEGNGTVYYADGSQYRGEWKNHAPHGKGSMYWVSNQKEMVAIWNMGRPVSILPAGDTNSRPQALMNGWKQQGRIFAVIVGVSRYPYVSNLQYADDDAYQLYAYLKSSTEGSHSNGQIQLLIDNKASKQNIIRALQSVAQQAGENDVVLFYFSGHGLPGAFLPIDYDGVNNQLYHEEIRILLRACRAKHKLVFADACHSGSLSTLNNPMTTSRDHVKTTQPVTSGEVTFLMSSQRNEYSLEDDEMGSGVFSHYLIRGLKGAADTDTNKTVTITELYNYVWFNVRKHTNQFQTPMLSGNFSRDMPLALVNG